MSYKELWNELKDMLINYADLDLFGGRDLFVFLISVMDADEARLVKLRGDK